ncbi:33284_t:CDS:2 [Gigaspora margarita]|uniref:33284_t:CDS:1 n=1 Tax=Gigaspora margarita TaxID=4874 RepID=A0ABN7UVI6_GIGMA|nr:33284_t:CDS:2 [Gigaspora margarita]
MVLAMQLLKENFLLQNYNFNFQPHRCLAHDLKEIEQSDVSTQWNSTYLMLSVYITMPTMIVALIRRNNNLNKYKLIPQEESNLQAVTQFLKPCYETTNVLSGSTYMTLSVSIVLIDSIVVTILLYLENPTSLEFLKVAATQMLIKVQKYANEIYNKIAFIAAILDPRVKLELISKDMNNEANHAFFNNIFRSKYSSPILNNSSTNFEINLIYTEQIAQKK